MTDQQVSKLSYAELKAAQEKEYGKKHLRNDGHCIECGGDVLVYDTEKRGKVVARRGSSDCCGVQEPLLI